MMVARKKPSPTSATQRRRKSAAMGRISSQRRGSFQRRKPMRGGEARMCLVGKRNRKPKPEGLNKARVSKRKIPVFRLVAPVAAGLGRGDRGARCLTRNPTASRARVSASLTAPCSRRATQGAGRIPVFRLAAPHCVKYGGDGQR